jgi:hypothetical protein
MKGRTDNRAGMNAIMKGEAVADLCRTYRAQSHPLTLFSHPYLRLPSIIFHSVSSEQKFYMHFLSDTYAQRALAISLFFI